MQPPLSSLHQEPSQPATTHSRGKQEGQQGPQQLSLSEQTTEPRIVASHSLDPQAQRGSHRERLCFDTLFLGA